MQVYGSFNQKAVWFQAHISTEMHSTRFGRARGKEGRPQKGSTFERTDKQLLQ
jgi:hypothetical protein